MPVHFIENKSFKETGTTQAWYPTAYRRREYPPNVLLVTSNSLKAQELKEGLENNGCMVYWLNPKADQAIKANRYFDLIVLDADDQEDGPDVYQKLGLDPALNGGPPLVLLTCDKSHHLVDKNKLLPIYHICEDAVSITTLLQIVEQIHYITYRYM